MSFPHPAAAALSRTIAAFCAAMLATGAAAITLPPGFAAVQLFAGTSLPGPTALAFLPDGSMLVTLQGGDLRVAQNGSVLPAPAISLGAKMCSNSERGLLGVAVDPKFATNRLVYLYYTFKKSGVCPIGDPTNASNPVNRVSRFVLPASNVIDPNSEVILVDNIPSPNGNHNGGDLHFGKDGYLYVSIGDGGADYAGDSGGGGANDAARDTHKLLGKILRIDRNGGIPPSNPFLGAQTGRCNVDGGTTAGFHCQETYAWGLRNPFRFAMDSNAPGVRFFINDVGQDVREEIDDGIAGADYGWNCREGTRVNNTTGRCDPTPPAMVDPIFEYTHGSAIPGTSSPGTCDAITGGAFVPNGLWPSMDNLYLAADFTCGVIFRLGKPASTWVAGDFASALGSNSATSLQFGPSGNGQALHFTTYAGGGQIWAIGYEAAGNNPPVAAGSATGASGSAPLAVTFSSAGSSDPDAGDSLTYFWDFGDGTTIATSSTGVVHTYQAAGGYTATLRARDNHFAFSPPQTFAIHAVSVPPSIDVDADGTYEALTDGLLVLRHMFGLAGSPLTQNALNAGAQRTAPEDVTAYLNSFGTTLDIDGNQHIDGLTDGLLIVRYLLGLRGAALVDRAIGTTRTQEEIEALLATLLP